MRAIQAVASVILAACGNSGPSTGPIGGTTPDGADETPDAGEIDASTDAGIAKLGNDAIVFAAALHGQSATDLYVTNGATTTQLTTTTGGELYPAISPDRKHIAFVRDFQLFVIDADGGNERLVAAKTGRMKGTRARFGTAAWSPDGTKLAYPYPRPPYIVDQDGVMVDESGWTTIHIINVDGTNDHVMPPMTDMALGASINSIAWSSTDMVGFMLGDDCPDCAGGYYFGVGKSDGTGFQYPSFQAEGVPSPENNLDWSPDASRWVFIIGANYTDYEGLGRLYTSTAMVDDERLLGSTLVWNPRFSPSGTEIAYLVPDGIYKIPAIGGTPQRVLAVTNARGIDW